jgi:hypothetical protein
MTISQLQLILRIIQASQALQSGNPKPVEDLVDDSVSDGTKEEIDKVVSVVKEIQSQPEFDFWGLLTFIIKLIVAVG